MRLLTVIVLVAAGVAHPSAGPAQNEPGIRASMSLHPRPVSPLLLLPTSSGPRLAGTWNQEGEGPRAGSGRTVGQLLLGLVGAWIVGAAGYKIGEGIADDRAVKGDISYSRAGNWGFILGSIVGSAGGVSLAGSAGSSGSYWAAVGGAAVPGLILLTGLDSGYLPLIGAVVVAPLQSIGATLGFHVSR